ncbi:2Fe-2S iron-sulfur cluster binding domain-containing protein [Halomicroarcula limicola]|uniref:2Fe-2S iron-sulfur cluster binding domain-containing protein n=1 Tax=Haloarcula limicola TaxID=1429915 RepID=A0A8J8C4S0_9EURY|nr:2Fe-2S iron-sulfur cluster-binding protein [Halomicroarcula limicola]MBV0925961.1 2Fe-2S iron-sulfur cluster binding domain-containing protein [Halomicroarcula limicola]
MVTTHTVEFVDMDRSIEVPETQTILEAADEAGLDLPYQCRMGVCGVCSALLVEEGEVQQTEAMFLSPAEKEEGYVLTCVAKPRSDLKLRSNEGP